MLPWWLLSLTPRDATQAVMRIWNQRQVVSAAALGVTAFWYVPPEQVAIITGWSVRMTSGIGSPGRASITIRPNNPTALPSFQQTVEAFSTGVPTTAVASASWAAFTLAGPGDEIAIGGEFGSGAAANSLIASFSAVLIPKGTLQVV